MAVKYKKWEQNKAKAHTHTHTWMLCRENQTMFLFVSSGWECVEHLSHNTQSEHRPNDFRFHFFYCYLLEDSLDGILTSYMSFFTRRFCRTHQWAYANSMIRRLVVSIILYVLLHWNFANKWRRNGKKEDFISELQKQSSDKQILNMLFGSSIDDF